MTNFEKIKSMSIEQLAHFLSGSIQMCKSDGGLTCELCDHFGDVICEEKSCIKWLQREVEE
jgi:hypothetical protein